MNGRRSLRIAVAGAGLIGRRHVAAIRDSGEAVAGIADPGEPGRAFAEAEGLPWHPDIGGLIGVERPDGIIVATPNRLHVPNGFDCLAAGVPMLVEKPLATDMAEGERLVRAAEEAGVPLLVGHHRRHNPIIAAAKAALDAGRIGRVVALHGMFWVRKPDTYFEADWRRAPGAGPILVNLIHDIDLMRHLCGEIVSVQAQVSHAVRGHPVEDSAAILIGFASGALGTVTVSDAVAAPWSWELTAAENPAYPATGQFCYLVGGTLGSLELPALRLWRHAGGCGWHDPMEYEQLPSATEDPLVRQIRHFAAVIRGESAPLVPGREGLRTLAVVEAIRRAAESGAAETTDLLHEASGHA